MRNSPTNEQVKCCRQQTNLPWLVAIAVLVSLRSFAHAEVRCVTVTTGDKAVIYVTRSYICANPDGTGGEVKSVTSQLGTGSPPRWRIPPNSVRTKYFHVPCSPGKQVVGFASVFLWPNADCATRNGRVRLAGMPLGTVTSQLACAKPNDAGDDGSCDLFTCPGDDGLLTACFTEMEPEFCECSDPLPPVLGDDYEIGGEMTDTALPEGYPTCHYVVTNARSGGGCESCPAEGDIYDNGVGCDTPGGCDRRLRGLTFDCPDGGPGRCRIDAQLESCEPGEPKTRCLFDIEYADACDDLDCFRRRQSICWENECDEDAPDCPSPADLICEDELSECGEGCEVSFNFSQCDDAFQINRCKNVRCPRQ